MRSLHLSESCKWHAYLGQLELVEVAQPIPICRDAETRPWRHAEAHADWKRRVEGALCRGDVG